jgi:hypothetical protein
VIKREYDAKHQHSEQHIQHKKKQERFCIRGKKPENDPLENDLVKLFASGLVCFWKGLTPSANRKQRHDYHYQPNRQSDSPH